VTRHPTSVWIVQQLREAFPYEPAIKFLILDHDAKYGTEVPGAIPSMEHRDRPDGGRLSLAERCRRAVGRQLPPRTAGPLQHNQLLPESEIFQELASMRSQAAGEQAQP
jgi:hypothetical protein